MRKLLWIAAAGALIAVWKKRADDLGSWSAAAKSLQADFTEALATRNDPNAPSIWARFWGGKDAGAE